jgi:hypothetical protein
MSNGKEPEWMVELDRRMDAAETWEEAEAIMHSDPNWIAMSAEMDEKRDRLRAERTRAEKPLVDDLHAAGIDVDSAWSLSREDSGAVPILLDHIARDYPDEVRDGIARALAVKSMRTELWPKIVVLYKGEPVGTDTKHGLASVLSNLVDRSTIDELIELLDNPVHGAGRTLLIPGVSQSRQPQALEALHRHVDDPDIGVGIKEALEKKERYRRRKAKKSS